MSDLDIKITNKVLCVIMHDGKFLVGRGFDNVKNEVFYRHLGGNLELNESPEEGMRREIREELNSEIDNLSFVTELNNSFIYNGNPYREKIFLYSGDLSNKELQEQKTIHIVETTYEFDAEWVEVSDVMSGKATLYPEYDWSGCLKR